MKKPTVINQHNYLHVRSASAVFGILHREDPKFAKEMANISKATAHRWIKDGVPDGPASRLLKIAACGWLPCAGKDWKGFHIFNGHLITPEGRVIDPKIIDSIAHQARIKPQSELASGRWDRPRKSIKKPAFTVKYEHIKQNNTFLANNASSNSANDSHFYQDDHKPQS